MLSYCPNCRIVKNIKDVDKICHHRYLPISWGRAIYWLDCPTCNFKWRGAMSFDEENVLIDFVESYFKEEKWGWERR